MARSLQRERSTLESRGSWRAWWLTALALSIGCVILVLAGLQSALPGPSEAAGPSAQGGESVPGSALDRALEFEPDVLADIAAYRSPRRTVALLSRTVAVAVPALIVMVLLGPTGERVLHPLRRLPGVALPVGAVVVVSVVAAATVRLPLSAWAGVVQDGEWGFRTRSVAGWMLDHLGVVMGRALLLGAVTVVTVLLVQRYPRTWPARLTVLAAVAGPLALLLHPLVVHPLLLPSVALPEGPHRDAIVAIVAQSSTPDVPVLIGEASLRTTRRNAVVTGLGPTQRIVLHDTMLELDPREVAAITAHELAHVERRDPLRGVLAAVPVVLLVGLLAQRRLAASSPASDRVSKVRSLAVLAVLMLALEAASTPLSAALSRTVEHRTDVRAVELSGDVDAYVAMLRAFVVDGLAEPDPPRWSVLLWATHPPPAARIAAVIEAEARLTAPVDLATR